MIHSSFHILLLFLFSVPYAKKNWFYPEKVIGFRRYGPQNRGLQIQVVWPKQIGRIPNGHISARKLIGGYFNNMQLNDPLRYKESYPIYRSVNRTRFLRLKEKKQKQIVAKKAINENLKEANKEKQKEAAALKKQLQDQENRIRLAALAAKQLERNKSREDLYTKQKNKKRQARRYGTTP